MKFSVSRKPQQRSKIRKRVKKLWSALKKEAIDSAFSLSKEEFIACFDIEYMSRRFASDNLTATEDDILKYYRHRVTENWPLPPGTLTDLRLNIDKLSPEQILAEADQILNFRLFGDDSMPRVTDEGDIDWFFNPISSLQWLWRLHRHQWWPVLGLAYQTSGNENYARAFVDQMLDWISRNPLPPRKNEKNYAWRLMEAGLRLRVSWIPCFALFYQSPNFTESAKLTMLRSIFDHAQFLFYHKTNRNHLLRESNGLAYAGVYFSEFHNAALWKKKALNRIDQEVQNQINHDGTHIEMSVGYQWLVVDELQKTYNLLQANDLSLPKQNLNVILKKMYRVLAHLIRPDGSFPEMNDGFIRWKYNRLAEAGRKFEQDELIFVGTAGKRGTAPKVTSVEFENAGLYIMRSDWTKDGRYMIFDAGPYGGPHGHEDKLSFELFAFGKPFIVDSGSYTYQKTDPFRSYFVGSQGHNTVMVDGMSQIRRWNPKNLKPKPVLGTHATWISKPGFDYVQSSYSEGYGVFSLRRPPDANAITDVTHTRHILFVKPDYWVIIDEMQASQHHDYEMLFHASPEIKVNIGAQNTVTFSGSETDACLYLTMENTLEFKISSFIGCVSPIQGWHSVGHHKKSPATAVIIRPPNARSIQWATLLYPLRKDQINADVAIKRVDVSCENSFAFEVTSHRGVDYLMVSDREGKKHLGPFESEGKIAVMRSDKSGNLLHAYHDGTD